MEMHDVEDCILEDECLVANSADVITQLQYSILEGISEELSFSEISINNGLSKAECRDQMGLIRNALVLSSKMLKSGAKKYVYDCECF